MALDNFDDYNDNREEDELEEDDDLYWGDEWW